MGFHMPGWPGGDPDAIRAAAKAWRALASDIESAQSDANATVHSVSAQWRGEAATSFTSQWGTFSGHVSTAVSEWRTLATHLDTVADKLDEAHQDYEHSLEVAAAAAVVGLGLTLFTFGSSDAIAAAAEATDIAWIASILTELSTALTAIAGIVGVSADVVLAAMNGMAISFVLSEGSQVATSELDGHGLSDVSQVQALEDSLIGGVGGAAGFSAGKWLAGGEDPALITRVLLGAGLGTGTNAAQQEFNIAVGLKKQFDLEGLMIAGASGAVGGIAEPKLGATDDSHTDPDPAPAHDPDPAPVHDPDPAPPTHDPAPPTGNGSGGDPATGPGTGNGTGTPATPGTHDRDAGSDPTGNGSTPPATPAHDREPAPAGHAN